MGVAEAIFLIASIVTTVVSSSVKGGMTAKARRQQAATEQAEAEKTAEQKRKVDRQKDRRRNLGTLSRQAEKRVAATGASRQKTRLQPTRSTPIEAPKAPPLPQAPAPSMAQQPQAPQAPQNIGANITKGVEIGATVAQGVASGVGAAQQGRADEARAQEIERLRDEEFKKAMSGLTKDVNLEAMDYQQAASALPNRNARSFNQDLAGTLRKFSGRRAA